MFSSVVVGTLVDKVCASVVSGTLSIIAGSLFGSVLLSVFKAIVMGTNFTVVVSGLTDVNGLLAVVNFWCEMVLVEGTVGFGDVDTFVVAVIRGDDDDDNNDGDDVYAELTVVDVIAEPSEK